MSRKNKIDPEEHSIPTISEESSELGTIRIIIALLPVLLDLRLSQLKV